MATPFKEELGEQAARRIGAELARVAPGFAPGFDERAFLVDAVPALGPLELKGRVNHLAATLVNHLPKDPEAAYAAMVASLAPPRPVGWTKGPEDGPGLAGWPVWPLTEAVALTGFDAFDAALDTLAEMTRRFTGEFAVRPFLLHDPDRAMQAVHRWSRSADVHVRRFASEGIRPRLPWGLRLTNFVADPAPILPVLETLRDDPEEYVRRSVANCLNDIGKDHPALLLDVVRDWMAGAPAARVRLLRHACRSRIKAGDADVLALFGYGDAPDVHCSAVDLEHSHLTVGEALPFAVTLSNRGSKQVPVMVDYIIHHVRANGARSAKVFKGGKMVLAPGASAQFRRTHKIVPISTRRYYPGVHRIEVQINGKVRTGADFSLSVD